jgi:hypothetical protein
MQADWSVAPCELVTLKKVRLCRNDERPMEYGLVPSRTGQVTLVQWKSNAKPKRVNLLANDCNLADLAQCAKEPRQTDKIVRWVSEWGLLGFRHTGQAPPSFTRWISAGRERFFGPEHRVGYGAEPLDMIVEAAKVAEVAVSLYDALRRGSVDQRAAAIRELVTQDRHVQIGPRVRVEPDGHEVSEGRCEMPMWVQGVFIGKQQEPRKPTHYTGLAVAGLGFLTDSYLGNEFQLYWSESSGNRRRLEIGWRVNSLLAGLYLKLGYSLRKVLCVACGFPIAHRKAGAKTCGVTCRKRLQRQLTD